MKFKKGMYLRCAHIDNTYGTISFVYRVKVTELREDYFEGKFQAYNKKSRKYSDTCPAVGGFYLAENKITKIKPFKL